MKRLIRYFKQQSPSQLVLMVALTLFFVVIMVFPLFSLFSKALYDNAGVFVGVQNYLDYFKTPTLLDSIFHTLDVSTVTAVMSTLLGFVFAYTLRRSNIKGKSTLKYLVLVPLFIPTIVQGLGLVYLFGAQGIVTRLGLDINLYGRTGIILAEIIYTLPQAFLMFDIALSYSDGRLYEAAEVMGAGSVKQFLRITIPEVKYTLISSLFVCFTLAFCDFGAPKVLGGSYNVLATDLYKQVAGQFHMNIGAVIGTLLLIPAIVSFVVDRVANRKSQEMFNSRSTDLAIKRSVARDTTLGVFCWAVAGFLVAMIAMLCVGAFSKYYPYNMSFTLDNFAFKQSSGGIGAFFNSIKMSGASAIIGAAFVFVYAYLVEKGKVVGVLKKTGKALSAVPIALPGLVIGLSFIFFFNAPNNPLGAIYGTIVILILANVLHFYSVPFVTATSALKKLDKEFESVSESMRAPWWKTFFRVSVPLSLPAILEIILFYFMNSMVTVSAVVFLYSANFKVASIAITHMEEAGDFAQAAAMSLLILGTNVIVRVVYEQAIKALKKRKKARKAVDDGARESVVSVPAFTPAGVTGAAAAIAAAPEIAPTAELASEITSD